MLSERQLKIAALYNILIDNVKKLVPILTDNFKKLVSNFFDKEKYVIHYKNLETLLEARIKTKKIHHILEFNPSQWLKPCIESNKQKRIEAEKTEDKDGKVLCRLMNNAIY